MGWVLYWIGVACLEDHRELTIDEGTHLIISWSTDCVGNSLFAADRVITRREV